MVFVATIATIVAVAGIAPKSSSRCFQQMMDRCNRCTCFSTMAAIVYSDYMEIMHEERRWFLWRHFTFGLVSDYSRVQIVSLLLKVKPTTKLGLPDGFKDEVLLLFLLIERPLARRQQKQERWRNRRISWR